MRVNVIGTYNLLEAAVSTIDSLERFIDFSTSEVFGTHAFRVEEGQVSTIGSVGEARWTYAVSKLAGEHMAHAYHDELGLPAVTVHPFNVFGPGQIGGGAIRAFIENALAGRDLVIHGDGSQIRAWCYVDDMVAGTLACLEHPAAPGQTFNIGNPRATVTIFDLAQRIRRLTGAEVDITFQPLHYADVELRIPNVEKAREVLGFEAKVDLDEGLEKTIAWYREKTLSPHPPSVSRAGEEELAEVRAVLESGALTMGPKVEELEELVAAACGVEHAVAVSNGTAALHLAVLALGIGEGDEVIVPAYTFPATANVVRLAGATPVLVDVDPATFNLDVAKVYDAVTPRTKAVLAVHLFGRPLDWEELQSAVPPDVTLLEDAAGALGAKWRGMPCGGLGAAGCLSFHPRKIVTTGEGGAVTTNDGELAASVRRLRHHGLDPGADIREPSTNYRLADILCAVGIPQLRRLDELLAERDADRGRLHGAPARPRRRPRGGRGRHARLAGVRDPARPQGRRARDPARGGDRGADRDVRAAAALGVPRPGAVPGRRRRLRPRARAPAPLPPDRRRPGPRRRGHRPLRLTFGDSEVNTHFL